MAMGPPPGAAPSGDGHVYVTKGSTLGLDQLARQRRLEANAAQPASATAPAKTPEEDEDGLQSFESNLRGFPSLHRDGVDRYTQGFLCEFLSRSLEPLLLSSQRRLSRLLPHLVQLVAHLHRHMHVRARVRLRCEAAAFGRTFLSLCRSASVCDCFLSMRCCHLRFSWLSSRCLPIGTQYCWRRSLDH